MIGPFDYDFLLLIGRFASLKVALEALIRHPTMFKPTDPIVRDMVAMEYRRIQEQLEKVIEQCEA